LRQGNAFRLFGVEQASSIPLIDAGSAACFDATKGEVSPRRRRRKQEFMLPRILIADDSSLIRNLLRKSLESVPGWKVCAEAVNGVEAIELAQRIHPDLIVLDLSMPVMNGLQAAKELSKLMPAVPKIMFTSFITQHLEQEAYASGVVRVISKDDPINTLISAVKSFAARDVA
jgi:CheY-like chemotaxis protein